MTGRTNIVDLLVPTGVGECPSGLLDPEVADFTAGDSIPVLLAARSIGQTVVAEPEIRRHPWLQLSHQLRHVEDTPRQKASVFGRSRGERQVHVSRHQCQTLASQCQGHLGRSVADTVKNGQENFIRHAQQDTFVLDKITVVNEQLPASAKSPHQ